tara:strand:+ start:1528 stop:2145 length:618 start_codon:yes stop_codon:yes gene_type:complete
VRNILIIAVPRSGSTNLLNSISSAYKFHPIFEPKPWHLYKTNLEMPSDLDKRVYNLNKKGRWEIKDNQVAKVISHPHKEFPNFYKEIINRYDETILLSRYDVKQQIESLAVLKNNKPGSRNPIRKWSEDELIEISPDHMKYVEDIIIRDRETIEKLSKEFNLPINYYEDVYSEKCLLNKNIKLDLEYFQKTKKCRTPSLESKYLL